MKLFKLIFLWQVSIKNLKQVIHQLVIEVIATTYSWPMVHVSWHRNLDCVAIVEDFQVVNFIIIPKEPDWHPLQLPCGIGNVNW